MLLPEDAFDTLTFEDLDAMYRAFLGRKLSRSEWEHRNDPVGDDESPEDDE